MRTLPLVIAVTALMFMNVFGYNNTCDVSIEYDESNPDPDLALVEITQVNACTTQHGKITIQHLDGEITEASINDCLKQQQQYIGTYLQTTFRYPLRPFITMFVFLQASMRLRSLRGSTTRRQRIRFARTGSSLCQ